MCARQQVLDVHDLMSDTDTTSDEQTGAVRVEAVVAAVRTLDEAPGLEGLVGLFAGFFVDGAGETCAGTANETDLLGALEHVWRGSMDSAFELRERSLLVLL